MEDISFKYIFQAVEDASHYSNIFTKDNFSTLEKWGLTKGMELVKFRFNRAFELKDLDKFLKDLFNDTVIKQNFPPLQNIILPGAQKEIEKFSYKLLSTKCTNLDIFDKIFEHNIVTEQTGRIKQDYDTYLEDITISDKLKECLLLEENENYNIFDENERNEFLFHIFRRIVVGGSLCQYEEYIQPYLDMTKSFYKDIVSPAKDPETKEIYIRSVPVEIQTIEENNLYKKQGHPQNFFYVIIDPYQRYVHLWYHNWIPFW